MPNEATTSRPIYLDHNASTPVPLRVREAMMAALEDGFGNPSATHAYGLRARAIVDQARRRVAALIGCDDDEIVFTGGGTEANNLALRGLAAKAGAASLTVVISNVEHPATLEPASVIAASGAVIRMVPVDTRGVLDPAAVERALAGVAGPILVSVILAQNETGVIQPVAEIAARAKSHGALVHTDAAQAVGKIEIDVHGLGVDLLSIAGHKLYAPKGVGALYVRRGVQLAPVVVGAGHERGLRPGTENVVGIAGLGEACALASETLAVESKRQRALRDRLEARLASAGFVVHGAFADRLPNTVNGRFPGVRGSALLAKVPEIAATTGSACHAGEEHASVALTAMGIAPEDALGAVRLTLGRGTTEDEIERAAALLIAAARA
ncbi:Cysteine desulfurase [Minicystis rosea]|nr:Cysteine desulfurase [Minicystis rosea]